MRYTTTDHDGQDAVIASDELAEAIERNIRRAAHGRINGLQVARHGEGIVLNGQCRTYHAKQLAQQAALDLAEGSAPLINAIVVC